MAKLLAFFREPQQSSGVINLYAKTVFLGLTVFATGCAQLGLAGIKSPLNEAPEVTETSSDRLAQRAALQTKIFTLQAQRMSLEGELYSGPMASPATYALKPGVSINDLLLRSEIHRIDNQLEQLEAQVAFQKVSP